MQKAPLKLYDNQNTNWTDLKDPFLPAALTVCSEDPRKTIPGHLPQTAFVEQTALVCANPGEVYGYDLMLELRDFSELIKDKNRTRYFESLIVSPNVKDQNLLEFYFYTLGMFADKLSMWTLKKPSVGGLDDASVRICFRYYSIAERILCRTAFNYLIDDVKINKILEVEQRVFEKLKNAFINARNDAKQLRAIVHTRGPALYRKFSFVSLYTSGEEFCVELLLNAQLSSESAVYLELSDVLPRVVSVLASALSMDNEQDTIIARMELASGSLEKRLTLTHNVLVDLENLEDSLRPLAGTVASGLSMVLLSGEEESYKPFVWASVLVLTLSIQGAHQSNQYYSIEETRKFAASGYRLAWNTELLKAFNKENINRKLRRAEVSFNEKTGVEYSIKKCEYSAERKPLLVYGAPGALDSLDPTACEPQWLPAPLNRRVPLATALFGRQKPLYRISDMVNLAESFPSAPTKKLRPTTPHYNRTAKPRWFSTASPGWKNTNGGFALKSAESGTSTVKKLAVFDFETIISENEAGSNVVRPYMLGVLCDERVFKQFYTPSDEKEASDAICDAGVEYMLDRLPGYVVFAHNLFKFDFILIISALVRVLIARGRTPAEALTFTKGSDKLLSVSIKGKRGEAITLVDSLHLIPLPLNDAADAFLGKRKASLGDTSIASVTVTDLKNAATLEKLKKYNRADCLLLLQVLRRFEHEVITKFKVQPLKFKTLPSVAFQIFCSVTPELESEAPIRVPPELFEGQIRASYRGGRCEKYATQLSASDNSQILYIDAESLYPAVAFGFDFPGGFFNRVIKPFVAKPEYPLAIGVYYCRVVCRNEGHKGIPFLSVRYGDHAVYPYGSWFGCYTSAELEYALELGYYDIQVLGGHTYTKRITPFPHYISMMYDWKREAEQTKNNGQRLIAKLLSNSLLGKFGQKPQTFKSVITRMWRPEEATKARTAQEKAQYKTYTYRNTRAIDLEYTLTTYVKNGEHPAYMRTFPQISSFVTAYGRIIIHRAMMLVIAQGGKIGYVDTDAIVAETPANFDLDRFNECLQQYYPRKPPGTLGLMRPVSLQTIKDKETKMQKSAHAAIKGAEKILSVKIVAPKIYHMTFEVDGKIQSISKHAGFAVPHGVSDNLEIWSELVSLADNLSTNGARSTITIPPRLVVSRTSFEIEQSETAERSILHGATSQIKRTTLWDTTGKAVGSAPVELTMHSTLGRGASAQRLQSALPPPVSWFTHSNVPTVPEQIPVICNSRVLPPHYDDFLTEYNRLRKALAEKREAAIRPPPPSVRTLAGLRHSKKTAPHSK